MTVEAGRHALGGPIRGGSRECRPPIALVGRAYGSTEFRLKLALRILLRALLAQKRQGGTLGPRRECARADRYRGRAELRPSAEIFVDRRRNHFLLRRDIGRDLSACARRPRRRRYSPNRQCCFAGTAARNRSAHCQSDRVALQIRPLTSPPPHRPDRHEPPSRKRGTFFFFFWARAWKGVRMRGSSGKGFGAIGGSGP